MSIARLRSIAQCEIVREIEFTRREIADPSRAIVANSFDESLRYLGHSLAAQAPHPIQRPLTVSIEGQLFKL